MRRGGTRKTKNQAKIPQAKLRGFNFIAIVRAYGYILALFADLEALYYLSVDAENGEFTVIAIKGFILFGGVPLLARALKIDPCEPRAGV